MSKKKRKRQNAAKDEDFNGINDDVESAAAADSEQSDDDDIAADSMIKVTFHTCSFSVKFKTRCSFIWRGCNGVVTVFGCNLVLRLFYSRPIAGPPWPVAHSRQRLCLFAHHIKGGANLFMVSALHISEIFALL